MSAHIINISHVTFSYPASVEPVLSSVSAHFTSGWTGIVGPNGVGKTTLAQIIAGKLEVVSGNLSIPQHMTRAYCRQESEFPPEGADDFLSDPSSGKIISLLEIQPDWPLRWETLSHGERKRFQLAVILSQEPNILICDEPVNHIDLQTKALLLRGLQEFRGIGILISHDREFLDTLCTHCLFMDPGEAVLRKGNYSEGFLQQEADEARRKKEYTQAQEVYRSLRKSAVAVKQRETGNKSRLSKKHVDKHDHDTKSKIDGARLTGKDKRGARKARVLEKRAERAAQEAQSLHYTQREIKGITLTGETARSDLILSLSARTIELGPAKRLHIPDLYLNPQDRIGVTGNNGAGKSTLISLLNEVYQLSREKLVFIPQEINEEEWKAVRKSFDDLDNSQKGLVYTALHRLGSEPKRVLFSSIPSPGERRKMMVAAGLLRSPHCIILDEPTNHMDIPSIRCLESALNDFTGALLMVSHDRTFLKNTTDRIWRIDGDGEENWLVESML